MSDMSLSLERIFLVSGTKNRIHSNGMKATSSKPVIDFIGSTDIKKNSAFLLSSVRILV